MPNATRDISPEQLAHLKEGGRIINTASVTAYRGSAQLLDYSATKGAIVAFTRSLSQSLIKQGIHVNAVAPGPVWTPLIPSPTGWRILAPARPWNGRASRRDPPCHAFLAGDDSPCMSGQVPHPMAEK